MVASTVMVGTFFLTSVAKPFMFIEGEHYALIAQDSTIIDDDIIEVVEAFSYGCSHCFHFDQQIMEWKETLSDNVHFARMPAIFRDSWLQLAKAFYAADATGHLEILHRLLFNVIHVEKLSLTTEDKLLDLVTGQGIDRHIFGKVMNSVSVAQRVEKALVMSRTLGINSVPAIVVNGKYYTDTLLLAGSINRMLPVVDFLIKKEEVRARLGVYKHVSP